MSMQWGVYEQRDEDDEFVAYHVMPVVVIEGEECRSGDHTLSADCPCGTFVEVSEKTGCTIVQHHDPEHPGALPENEWREKTRGM
jgi:hypothetical protein